ncbi:BTAD domain-containing putative transcriptional regulator [Streptomyces zhihengii]
MAEALALWRGSAFAEADTPWFNAQRQLLDSERLAAQLELADVRLRLGQHDGMVSELATRARSYPLDERVTGQLILALNRCGRQAEALEVYERARRRLAHELGVDPGAALRRLHERILAGDPEPAEPAPPHRPPPHNRPARAARRSDRPWCANWYPGFSQRTRHSSSAGRARWTRPVGYSARSSPVRRRY